MSRALLQKSDVNDGLFTWCFNDKEYLESKDKIISSDRFIIGGFEWILDVDANKGTLNVYLRIITNIGKNKENITVNYRLYNHETMCSFTNITTFNEKQEKCGWNENTLRLKQLLQFDEITISCYINILKIFDENILYQTPNTITKHPLYNNCSFEIEWKIDENMKKIMKNANVGQSFESDIKYKMFVFGVYINGIDSYSVYVSLCHLPPNISKLITKIKLICKENEIEFEKDNVIFSYNHNTEIFKPFNSKQFHQYNNITFIAQFKVLKHYDLNDKPYHHKVRKKKPNLEIKKTDSMPSEIKWLLNKTEINDIKQGQYIDSELCEIWGLKWFLRFFPVTNDNNDKTKSCALFLCLNGMASTIREIVVNYRLFCNETSTSYTEIAIFNETNWCQGFSSNTNNMMINDDVFLDNIIYLNCYINIIKIINDNHYISYLTPMKLRENKYCFEWFINKNMIKKLLKSPNGKRWESNIYKNMYLLHCYPNGIDNKRMNEVQICIQQCLFPENIDSIKAKIKIICPQLNKIWSAVYNIELQKNTTKPWPIGTLLKHELNGLESITFSTEIVIIEPVIKNNKKEINLDGSYKDKYYQNNKKNTLLSIVIKGFMDKYNITNKNWIELIQCYYPYNIYEWNITDKNLLKHFLISKNKEKYESDIFEIGGFKWFLKGYPNGFNQRNYGYFQLFLTLALLPSHISMIETSICLSCCNTNTSYSFFACFSKKHKTWGWHRNLCLDELRGLFLINKYKKLTFQCNIIILKVISSINGSLIYEYSHLSPLNYYEYEWHINSDLMEMFRSSPNGKVYESSVFNDMFLCQCYPNGFELNEENNVRIFVQIIAFPPGIKEIIAKLEILCIEIGIRWLIIGRFNILDNNWGFSKGVLNTHKLYKYNHLTFKIKIKFLQLFHNHNNNIWKYQEQINSFGLISGYIRKYSNYNNNITIFGRIIDIIRYFSLYHDDDDDKQCECFTLRKPKQTIKFEMNQFDPRFISDLWEFYNLKWVLQSYIHSQFDDIYYDVMLSLISIPCNLSQIIIGYRLFCDQTMSSTSGICVLSKDQLSSKYLLMKNEINNQDLILSFKCGMRILSIKDIDGFMLYQYPCHLEYKLNELNNQFIKQYKIKWKMDKYLINRFKNAYQDQTFETKNVYEDMFCLGIIPNACHQNEGQKNCIIYLCICSLPFDIYHIKLKWKLQSDELGINTMKRLSHFNNNDILSSMIISKSNEFIDEINDLKEIIINVEIEIIQFRDRDHQYIGGYSYRSNSARTTVIHSLKTRSARTSISDQ